MPAITPSDSLLTMNFDHPTIPMHPNPSDPFLGQITLPEDKGFHPNQHAELHNCNGLPDLPCISIDSYSTGLSNYITFLPSPNANAFGTSNAGM